ncbi:hypothetical protein MVEN_01419200 [Mycena venus]|uniref:Uncharacterized protein n=1 Tax=Mycena venus TaxID=2733690 RepID=A0A8H6XZ81_9AGAR|nr:hypothetical protein MVEN_01419200 [Mycena venus]
MDSLSSLIPISLRRGLLHTASLLGLSTPDPAENETTASSASSAPKDPLELSVHHLVATRDLLLIFFPPELVYVILDLAEYWAQVKSARAQAVQLSTFGSADADASMCYLVLPAILEHELYADADVDAESTIHVKVRRVQFTTVSHDQGWCSDPALRGTYRGSTWFEAAILRPSQAQAPSPSPPPTPPPTQTQTQTQTQPPHHGPPASAPPPAGLDPALGYDPVLEVASAAADGDGRRRWNVQRNFCASNDHRAHVVAWGAVVHPPNSNSDPGAESENADTGAGCGAGFVECLVPGDRIAVIARARYPGWSNFIQRVEVSVYYGLA